MRNNFICFGTDDGKTDTYVNTNYIRKVVYNADEDKTYILLDGEEKPILLLGDHTEEIMNEIDKAESIL